MYFRVALLLKILVVFLFFSTLAVADVKGSEPISQQSQKKSQQQHNKWLQDRFSEQHQQLIPVVAVADMYFACTLANEQHEQQFNVTHLVTVMDKQELAERLESCLAGESIQSDLAVNYGLIGCFHEQVADLPEDERKMKMKLVKKAIVSLSKEQRQQSFTQCVTDQAISYLH